MLNYTFYKKSFYTSLFVIYKKCQALKIIQEIQELISKELNLKVKKLINKFNNSLIELEIKTKEIEKVNENDRLKTEKNRKHGKKSIRRI